MLIQSVIQHIQKESLFLAHDRCILSFSGGPDSVFLFYVLKQILVPQNILLVYFDHGLRAQASEEATFTQSLADSCQIPYRIIPLDVTAQAKKQKQSIETMARTLRRDGLIQLAKELQYSVILSAHHLDDQCETYFYQLIRGAKTHLGGMKPKVEVFKGIHWVRPLLQMTKSEILAYLHEHRLSYFLDQTNQETIYTRNKIRHEILPQIEAINPGYRKVFQSHIAYLNELDLYLTKVCEPIFAKCIKDTFFIRLDLFYLKCEDIFIQKRIIFLMSIQLYDHSYEIATCHIEKIFTAIQLGQITTISLPQGRVCRITQDQLSFFRAKPKEHPLCEFCYEFYSLPDKIFLKELSLVIEFKKIECQDSALFIQSETGFSRQSFDFSVSEIFLDYDKISSGSSFVIRSRKPQDRFWPLGCAYSVRLKKYLIDKKIPQAIRWKMPLLFVNDLLVCLIGYQISDQVKVTSNTKVILHILTYPSSKSRAEG